MRKSLFFVIALLVATILACGFNVSSANIDDAKMAKDSEGKQSTTVFAQDDTFYAIVEVANAPDDTKVKAVWVAVEADGVDSDFVIGEKELEGGGTLTFSVSNTDDKLWPAGRYKVDLYLNDELDRSLEFKVEGQAVAEEPTDTPEPEPTDTPEPEPTDTPEPEPTDTPEPEPTDESATGDTITQPTEEAVEEPEALPFQSDPYVHSSGAFSFAIPEGWEISQEEETSVTVSSVDTVATVSSLFLEAGREFSEAEMEEFSEQLVDAFTGGKEYEVLTSEQDEDGVYVQVAFELVGVDVISDFFFVQQDTIVYVLNFIAVDYDEMLPTWEIIIDSYDTDLAAAKSSSAPAATPTPAPPPPTPTPAPAANPFAPQPGRARLYVFNEYGEEITFTIAGQEHKIPTGTPDDAKPIDLDPGRYTYTISIPGGAVNGEVEMGGDQSWAVGVRGDGAVYDPFQVYP